MKALIFKTQFGVFVVRLWPTVFTLLGLIVLFKLGFWQVDRLHWKEHLLSEISERMGEPPLDLNSLDLSQPKDVTIDLNYHPAIAVGAFQNEKQIFLHAISRTGEGGYHVLTPFKLVHGKILIVDRGWVPFQSRERYDFSMPNGQVTIHGLLRKPEHSWVQPKNDPSHGEWFWPDLGAISGIPFDSQTPDDLIGSFFLSVDAGVSADELPRGGQTQLDLPNNHFSYAITWFSLAFALAIIYSMSSFRKVL